MAVMDIGPNSCETVHRFMGAAQWPRGARRLRNLCRVYFLDDAAPDGTQGLWMQHGDNEEARRFFERRSDESWSDNAARVRREVDAWCDECHRYWDTTLSNFVQVL
jgi:hypothetical protein